MTTKQDQRRTPRIVCESPIVCSSLNGQTLYSARTLNCCESGLSFITQTPLKAGMTIFFRADTRTQKRLASPSSNTIRGTGLAQIRWCRRLRSKASASYRVGAEYMEPYP